MDKQTLTLTAKSFLGGLAPSLRVGLPGQYSPQSRGIDPFRQLGGLSAGYYAKPIGGTTVSDLVQWLVPGSGTASGDSQYLYGYGNTGRIYRIGQQDESVSLIKAVGSSLGEGLERYAQSGTMYLFYARTTDIGRSDATWTTSGSYTDNYWTGTLGQSALSSNPHPLKSFLTSIYVADGNVLHEINGTTVTTSKLVLPKTQTIVQMEVTETEIVCLTRTIANGTFVGNARLYYWDGVATRYTHVTNLSESSAPCLINNGGSVYVCLGTGVKYLVEAGGMTKVATLPLNTLPVPGGASARNGVLYLLGLGTDYSGRVLTFGSPYPEVQASLHNTAVTPTGTSASQVGALVAVDNNNLIGSFFDGSTYQLIRWSANYSPNCSLVTLALNGDSIRLKNFDTFKFYFSTLIADESLKFYYAINGGDFLPFDGNNPSYVGYTTFSSLSATLFSALSSTKFSDLGAALAFWQIEQNVHANELQLMVQLIPSQDYSLCPIFYGAELTYEDIRS